MATAQQRIEHQLGLTLDHFGDEQLVADLFDAEEEGPVRRRRKGDPAEPSALPAAEPTPLSNRGVRSLTTVHNHSTTARRFK
jgi:hypothetical protein